MKPYLLQRRDFQLSLKQSRCIFCINLKGGGATFPDNLHLRSSQSPQHTTHRSRVLEQDLMSVPEGKSIHGEGMCFLSGASWTVLLGRTHSSGQFCCKGAMHLRVRVPALFLSHSSSHIYLTCYCLAVWHEWTIVFLRSLMCKWESIAMIRWAISPSPRAVQDCLLCALSNQHI